MPAKVISDMYCIFITQILITILQGDYARALLSRLSILYCIFITQILIAILQGDYARVLPSWLDIDSDTYHYEDSDTYHMRGNSLLKVK